MRKPISRSLAAFRHDRKVYEPISTVVPFPGEELDNRIFLRWLNGDTPDAVAREFRVGTSFIDRIIRERVRAIPQKVAA